MADMKSFNLLIDDAAAWLFEKHKHYHHNSDIWHLKWNWGSLRDEILQNLKNGNYRFSPVTRKYIKVKLKSFFVLKILLS
jgi:hypothetical protein